MEAAARIITQVTQVKLKSPQINFEFFYSGERLFRGYKELCSHTDRLCDITHIVFVVHGVGQVVDDTTIIRNTNIMRDNVTQILAKHFPKFQMETGQRVEFFPVEWRSSLRLD